MRPMILLLPLLLAGCGATTAEVGSNDFDPNKVAYFKDNRTDLCFAVVSYSRIAAARVAYGMSHSVVPCSPAVERLLTRSRTRDRSR